MMVNPHFQCAGGTGFAPPGAVLPVFGLLVALNLLIAFLLPLAAMAPLYLNAVARTLEFNI